MTYEEICAYIYDIPKYTKKNGLEHTRELLTRLGNPHRRFEVIHVAGSNGKGSVCAFINSALCRAGKQTGLFTSPHLVRMEERFVVNGAECTQEDFIEAFFKVQDAVHKMQQDGFAHPAFFEFLFAMGMVIFVKNKVRYVVLETGLGGRLDATNIFEEPMLTIITSLSLEHTEILGDTIEQIAAEKAGIIKEGVPVVFDGSQKAAAKVVRERARAMRAPFYEISVKNLKILEITGKNIDFCYSSGYDEVNLRVPFAAEYQMMNAALAYQALAMLSIGLDIYPVQITEGIANAVWRGRMQEVQEGVYFDGAHNSDGIAVFLKTVERICEKPPLLLFSMVREKNYQKVIEELCTKVKWARIILTKIPDERGIEPERLAEEFAKYQTKTQVVYDCRDAYLEALSQKEETQKLFCAGSLYLIGELQQVQENSESLFAANKDSKQI